MLYLDHALLYTSQDVCVRSDVGAWKYFHVRRQTLTTKVWAASIPYGPAVVIKTPVAVILELKRMRYANLFCILWERSILGRCLQENRLEAGRCAFLGSIVNVS